MLTLNTAQYDALGIPLVGGTLSVVGTSAPNRIFGTAGNDSLKGFGGNDLLLGGLGNDKIFGGFGKDTLTGNGGRDAFVFDTKLNKKTNVDKITDFNVRDDSVYLDNAIFKKLGTGNGRKSEEIEQGFLHGRERGEGSERLRDLRQEEGRSLLRPGRLGLEGAGRGRNPEKESEDDV